MAVKPCALVILDGFGYRKETEYNAIAKARTPCLNMLFKTYPHTFLHASGTAVGLPDGYIGNSEVGHMTIGCGKIIQQPITKINQEIADNTLKDNPTLQNNFSLLAKKQKDLHIMGLLSDAGVHAHIKHMIAFVEIAQQYDIKNIWLHLFLDGRDSPPQSASSYLSTLKGAIKNRENVQIGSLTGRFFSMDRDSNWNRTCKTVDMLVSPDTKANTNKPETIIEKYYAEKIYDEFIPPTLLNTYAQVNSNDGIICTNFRPDRIRQLTSALTTPDKKLCAVSVPKLSFFISPVNYGNDLSTTALLEKTPTTENLKEMLSTRGKTLFTIAETEKYAHVTYFFSGGREEKFPGERCILVPSIEAENYIEHPCMSANTITKLVLQSLKNDPKDFYLINYANADMVGHSGDFKATVKAIECLDTQIRKLYEQIVITMNGSLFITSDHGNAEQMYDKENQQPHTAHTTNFVPFIAVSNDKAINQKKVSTLHELKDIMQFLLSFTPLVKK